MADPAQSAARAARLAAALRANLARRKARVRDVASELDPHAAKGSDPAPAAAGEATPVPRE